MKHKQFRFLTLILSFSLLATIMLTNSAFALSNDSPILSQEVVYKTVSAMDSHDWDTYVALQCNENKADFESFLGSKDNKAQQIGLFRPCLKNKSCTILQDCVSCVHGNKKA